MVDGYGCFFPLKIGKRLITPHLDKQVRLGPLWTRPLVIGVIPFALAAGGRIQLAPADARASALPAPHGPETCPDMAVSAGRESPFGHFRPTRTGSIVRIRNKDLRLMNIWANMQGKYDSAESENNFQNRRFYYAGW